MDAVLKPGISVSWIPKGEEVLRPVVYAACILGRQKAKGDTSRRTGQPLSIGADSMLQTVRTAMVPADSSRSVNACNQVESDSFRRIVSTKKVHGHMKRRTGNGQNSEGDACRGIVWPEHAFLHPAVYVVSLLRGSEILSPVMFAAMVPPSRQLVTTSADARRKVSCFSMSEADTERGISSSDRADADTRRGVCSPFIALAVSTLLRRLVLSNTERADTARTLVGIYEKVYADTSRILSPDYCTARGKTWRLITQLEQTTCDTCRTAGIGSSDRADLFRKTGRKTPVLLDALRSLVKRERVPADTSVRVPHVLTYVKHSESDGNFPGQNRHSAAPYPVMQNFHHHGIKSFSMTLGELTLSDTFQLATVQPMNIDDAVQGQILDYDFHFLVEETSQRDLVQTVKGMYSKDVLLYTAIRIFVEEANVSYYAQEIAHALGLGLDMHCDDFIPSQNYEDSGMTYQDFISSLFGWTFKLPQRQINVFIRGDTLHIIQRGLEESVVDITDWPHSRPTVERKLVRSIWHSSNNEDGDNQAHNEDDTDPIPFTGTISLGEISRTYRDGYLTYETNEEGYTEYSYSGEYLSEKRTHNKDGSTSQTRYYYAETNRDVYLFKEQERTTESMDDDREHGVYDWEDWESGKGSERVTYHAPLGFGWYSTTVYVDGALEGSSLSQGKPGGKASRFTIDQSNLSLGSHYVSYEDPGRAEPSFTSLVDTEFPVKGEQYLWILTQAIEWLNRKTQETVTLEVHARILDGVPDVDHIVDFTERIRFDGHEYFLQSNAVELTPRSLKQTIKMTRWY